MTEMVFAGIAFVIFVTTVGVLIELAVRRRTKKG